MKYTNKLFRGKMNRIFKLVCGTIKIITNWSGIKGFRHGLTEIVNAFRGNK